MEATHAISLPFLAAFTSEAGILQPALAAVQRDDTLMLGLRGGYVSIYYRGANLLNIKPVSGGAYRAIINDAYDTEGILSGRFPTLNAAGGLDLPLENADQTKAIFDLFDKLKGLVDRHPKLRSAHEREFQQLVVRENNRTRTAGSSHYFITDMEHANGDARFDMLGVRWLHNERKRGDRLVPVIFEMKYGEQALEGEAGMAEHLKDMLDRLKSDDFRSTLRANVSAQFTQLQALGLLNFNRSEAISQFTAVEDRIQLIFLLAGYNPRSSRLGAVLKEEGGVERIMASEQDHLAASGLSVDLRFFHASFCGYSMHEDSMLTLEETRRVLKRWRGARGEPQA
ncbi:hypothetical protein K3217_21005 [bacterium BD-1]|nr:hypothetical protein [Ottowia caeni]